MPQSKENLAALWRLTKIMLTNMEFEDVASKVVNAILTELGYLNMGYRIVVLSLIDEKAGGLRRVALSQTSEATKAVTASTIPFEKIVIPFSATENYCVKVINEKRPLVTTSWPDLLTPPLTPEAALANQTASGIKTSMVYPVFADNKPIGSLIFSMVKDYKDVTDQEKDLIKGFTDLVGLAVQNSLLYTSLRQTRDSLKVTSEQLTRANSRLQDLDHLKDDFVSVASHELRTPMTAVRSYAWMALNRSDVPISPKLHRYLDRILISTERLINLVNDMLNVSRIESGRLSIAPQVFDITELAKDVLAEVEPKAAEKALHLKLVMTSAPKVFADPDKVHQVLLNLIGNALKFTPQNGTITISFLADGQFVEVTVTDSGVGISKEDQSRLFQKFGRLDNSYVAAATSGGTGLGLFICKSLIELMKGKIWASSPGPGKGTTFAFTIPTASQANLAHPEQYVHKATGEAKVLEPVSL